MRQVRTVVDATFQQRPVLLQQSKLVDRQKSVVDSVRFAVASGSGRHWNSPQIQIVADRVLKIMVHRALGVSRVQILT